MKGGSLGSMIARNGQSGCNCSQPNPQATQIGNAIGGIFGNPQPQPQQSPPNGGAFDMNSGWGQNNGYRPTGFAPSPTMYTTRQQPGYQPSPQANIFQRGPTPDMMHSMSMFKGLFG